MSHINQEDVMKVARLAMIEVDEEKIGKGSGFALDGGVSYAINRQFKVFAGIRSQIHNLEFDNGNNQKHRRGGIFNGVQFQF